jgi:hypothetical protein
MSNIPEKDFMYLEELIRKVDDYLMPQPSDRLDYLYSKDLRDRLYGQNPKCFLKIKGVGREFPTCYSGELCEFPYQPCCSSPSHPLCSRRRRRVKPFRSAGRNARRSTG